MIGGSIPDSFRRILSSLKGSEWLCPPAGLLFILPRGLSLLLKWPGCVTDNSAPSSADCKIEWGCNSTPPSAFVACGGTALLSFCSHGKFQKYTTRYSTTLVKLLQVTWHYIPTHDVVYLRNIFSTLVYNSAVYT
jgi:hypothetical protein